MGTGKTTGLGAERFASGAVPAGREWKREQARERESQMIGAPHGTLMLGTILRSASAMVNTKGMEPVQVLARNF